VDAPDPMWNTENLYVVAFIHRDGQKGGKYMHVFNSTEGNLSISDGINTLENASAASAVYDLSGRKLETRNQQLETLPKGIYIVNGKKLVVK
jgi:flagellar capping protein FliD